MEARSEEEVLVEAENMSEQGGEAVGVIELLRIMVERDMIGIIGRNLGGLKRSRGGRLRRKPV